jgi:hypothetical protein
MVNDYRVYRVYRAVEIAVPQRKRKQVAAKRGQSVRIGTMPNEHLSLDFISDTVSTGRRLRMPPSSTRAPGKHWRLQWTRRCPARPEPGG